MAKNKTYRALHVVDVENEIMSGTFGLQDVVRLHNAWDATVKPHVGDQYFLATGDRTKLELAFGWQDARPVFRPGKDGADDAIVEFLDIEHIAKRYTHVFIGSGDHKIQPAAKKLIEAGVKVTIVARHKHVHHSYFTIGAEIVYLDEQWALAA